VRVETDLALACLEADGGDGERRIVTVVHCDIDFRSALHVGA